jgi:MoaA/NifB/PqqE/SkfB family radical SAM enzyme
VPAFDLLAAAVAESQAAGAVGGQAAGGEPTLHPEFRKIADFLTAAAWICPWKPTPP